PEQMRVRFHHPPISRLSILPYPVAEFPSIPNRKFHRQRWEKRRLLSTPSQPRPHAEGLAILGHLKITRSVVVRLICRVMRNPSNEAVQRHLVTRIEKMINADRNLAPVPDERFLWTINPAPYLRIITGITSARHANPYVSLR